MGIGIYRILNTVTGKSYVGQSVNLRNRRVSHFVKLKAGKHHNRRLQNSYKKHGRAAFVFEVLAECSADELTLLEQVYCDQFDAVKNGYNIRVCVDSNAGVKFDLSDDARAVLSERAKNMQADPEFKKAHSERTKKRNADPDVKKEQSERRRKMSNDPEFKKALSERTKNMHADPEFKKALSERMKKMQADPEFKKANSERLKARNADPGFKKAHLERLKKRNADNNFKKQFVAASQANWSDSAKKASRLAKCRATRSRKKRLIQGTLFDVE